MESRDHDAGAFRPGDPPIIIKKRVGDSTSWVLLFRIWSALIVCCLLGSCLGAPFLVPLFQLFLIPPILGAIALGAIGGLCRTRWFTVIVWSALVIGYVWHDIETNPFGYVSMYATYILNDPPQLFEYYHSWENLYQITIIPLTFGVTALTHGWVAERRRSVRRCEAHRDA